MHLIHYVILYSSAEAILRIVNLIHTFEYNAIRGYKFVFVNEPTVIAYFAYCKLAYEKCTHRKMCIT